MRLWAGIAVLMAGCAAADSDRAALKEELKREIMAELREAPADGAVQPGPTGDVEGRLVFKGGGVAGCDLKLVRLLESDSFLGMFREVRQGTEFDAKSDPDGRFGLHGIPPGHYRLFWRVPGDTGWIRRLREAPDAVVEPGKTFRVPEIDLDRRPVGTTFP